MLGLFVSCIARATQARLGRAFSLAFWLWRCCSPLPGRAGPKVCFVFVQPFTSSVGRRDTTGDWNCRLGWDETGDPSCHRARLPSRLVAASIYLGRPAEREGHAVTLTRSDDDAPLPRSLPSDSSATPVSSSSSASVVTVSRTLTRTSPCSTHHFHPTHPPRVRTIPLPLLCKHH